MPPFAPGLFSTAICWRRRSPEGAAAWRDFDCRIATMPMSELKSAAKTADRTKSTNGNSSVNEALHCPCLRNSSCLYSSSSRWVRELVNISSSLMFRTHSLVLAPQSSISAFDSLMS
jgi:hypothetical protein